MRLIVDANIIFSALIKDGLARKIVFAPELELYSPRYLTLEIHAHLPEILKKSKLSDEKLSRVSNLILSQIIMIEDKQITPFYPAAISLIADENDRPYFAAALAIGSDVWSQDNDFSNQTRVKIWKTKELAEKLEYVKS